MKIKLSVITAVYNRVDMIAEAVESVWGQWVDGMEHIIIDGGSTDGTLEVLKNYHHLRIVSEPDNGIYDAWNKGIRLAGGDFITFLNSDDTWFHEAVEPIISSLNFDQDEILIGNAIVFNTQNSQVFFQKKYEALSSEDILKNLTRRPPAINAWVIPKKIIDNNNGFNSDYKIASDVDFCLRLIIQKVKIRPLDFDFYKYISHPDSLTLNQSRKAKFDYQYENMIIAARLIDNVVMNSHQKKALKQWLSVTCYNLLVHSVILNMKVHTKLKIVTIGLKNNLLFPVLLVHYSVKYLAKTKVIHRKNTHR